MDLSQTSDESKVLVLNTGGTINMILSQQGYVPEPYFLTETLRSQNRFHDPLGESLFSHSASIEGYREWSSNSGRASPVGRDFGGHGFVPRGGSQSLHSLPTLPVRSSRPIGITDVIPQYPNITEQTVKKLPLSTKIADDIYEAQLPALITPRSTAPGGIQKRIRYAVLEVSSL